jgi:hypothetical protein
MEEILQNLDISSRHIFSSEISFFFLQYYDLTDVYKIITVAVFIVLSILEGIRLYLGYSGNLKEKVVYS